MQLQVTNTPDLQHSFVNVDEFAVNAEHEVGCFWTIKLFPEGLGYCHEIIVLYNKTKYMSMRRLIFYTLFNYENNILEQLLRLSASFSHHLAAD